MRQAQNPRQPAVKLHQNQVHVQHLAILGPMQEAGAAYLYARPQHNRPSSTPFTTRQHQRQGIILSCAPTLTTSISMMLATETSCNVNTRSQRQSINQNQAGKLIYARASNNQRTQAILQNQKHYLCSVSRLTFSNKREHNGYTALVKKQLLTAWPDISSRFNSRSHLQVTFK